MGLEVDFNKVAVMSEWPKPKSLKALRGLLRLIGYYCKLIYNYGSIACPLTKLFKNDGFLWNDKVECAFIVLKKVILMQAKRPIAHFIQALHGTNLKYVTLYVRQKNKEQSIDLTNIR